MEETSTEEEVTEVVAWAEDTEDEIEEKVWEADDAEEELQRISICTPRERNKLTRQSHQQLLVSSSHRDISPIARQF